ncbi:hypothetical protein H9Q13_15995 [Pontibacter sp. JH31]|uniref:Uncharacterized protein n=1 Tax=Pontibacter aquaedesilientis TaxID=2766980 RepID=A0ABR7XK63_9BACT|nr:hypothetical protein [Pontibacter aquaedesilientis]MBD1398675.1 hypothetical protein [Pontibacter aquaedesilientis]
MKKLPLLTLLLTLPYLLVSCNSGEQEHTKITPAIPEPGQDAVRQLCFLQVTKGSPATIAGEAIDSLLIRLTIQGDSVTGILHWLPSQKDTMKGTLAGTLQDSILTATYTYMAEGVTAKEERIFKIEADTIWMKTGELEEKSGLWVLKNKEFAPYTQAIPRIACP